MTFTKRAIDIPGTTKVTYENFIVLKETGVIVATLNAEFDLKDVPGKYHSIMIGMMKPSILYMADPAQHEKRWKKEIKKIKIGFKDYFFLKYLTKIRNIFTDYGYHI
ncbi:MAG: hypothetical protein H8D97_01645 [Proteobacteria bacterium]|nr:hypothetical protein [Pseudomonadota bacterium]